MTTYKESRPAGNGTAIKDSTTTGFEHISDYRPETVAAVVGFRLRREAARRIPLGDPWGSGRG